VPVETGSALPSAAGPAFIYSGNGSQWAGMGKRLLAEDPLFRATVREVDALFQRHADTSLEDELAGNNGEGRYEFTEIGQPALFALQVGITQMLRQHGISPAAVAGHSVGEVAAAWAAGALSLADAVEVIYQRSRLQGTTRGQGQMSAVGLGEAQIRDLLDELGAERFAGARRDQQRARRHRRRRSRDARPARVGTGRQADLPQAARSRLRLSQSGNGLRSKAGIRQALSRAAARRDQRAFLLHGQRRAVARRIDSTPSTGGTTSASRCCFEQAITNLLDSGINLFIEIGPNPVLRSYLNDCLKARAVEGRVIATAIRGDDSPERIRDAAASQAMIAGGRVDWPVFFPRPAGFVQLPNYPWQRERHWHPVTPEAMGLIYRRKVHPLLGYPLPQHELTWENQLDTQLYPVLADHVVGEATSSPARALPNSRWLPLLAWHPGELVEIEELEIRSPLADRR
jgi:phthiocerol/phenolphthiocerol synthesis type-I polyketide synthase C